MDGLLPTGLTHLLFVYSGDPVKAAWVYSCFWVGIIMLEYVGVGGAPVLLHWCSVAGVAGAV